jgi:hypothetical protein
LKPWQLKREARAQIEIRREEMLALAQAERDVDDIRSGRKQLSSDGRLIALPAPSLPSLSEPTPPHIGAEVLAQIASHGIVADHIRREVNLSKSVIFAERELEQDPQAPPSRKVEGDWLFRWRDCASAVSSEELQDLWGRVLAGEIKSPGSFSLRALEFLRNISQDEATAIAKVSQFVINDVVFRGDKVILNEEGITDSFLLSMQQLGVLAGVEAIGLTITWKSADSSSFIRPLTSNGRVLLVKHDDANKEIQLPIYQLTSIGHQILRLGRFEPHDVYLRKLGQAIKSQGFEVVLANYIQVSENQIQCFHEEVL